MADALCGPSNPLQSFKNHSQVDRTLQQDRFTPTQHSPTQEFRTRDPRSGLLDTEFCAFEAGPAQPHHLLQQQQSLIPFRGPEPAEHSIQSHYQNGSSKPPWVSDFQNLHLHSPPPQPVTPNQFRSTAPVSRSNVGGRYDGWHDEFLRHNQPQQLPQPVRTVNGELAEVWSQTEPHQSHGLLSQHSFPLQRPEFHQGAQFPAAEGTYESQSTEPLDDAAFDAAFAQAENLHQLQQAEHQSELAVTGEVAGVRLDPIYQTHPFGHSLDPYVHQQEHGIRIGSDAIPYPEPEKHRNPQQKAQDADELARTAGLLVDSVSHDTSAKFEQSQFLSLMRKIRDRKVEVQGEELRETEKLSSHNNGMENGRHATLTSTTNAPLLSDFSPSSSSRPTIDGATQHDQDQSVNRRTESQMPTRRNFVPLPVQGGRQRAESLGSSVRSRGVEEAEARLEPAHSLHPGGTRYPGTDNNDGYSRQQQQQRGGMSTVDDVHRYDHWASGGIGPGDGVGQVGEDEDRVDGSLGYIGHYGRD